MELRSRELLKIIPSQHGKSNDGRAFSIGAGEFIRPKQNYGYGLATSLSSRIPRLFLTHRFLKICRFGFFWLRSKFSDHMRYLPAYVRKLGLNV